MQHRAIFVALALAAVGLSGCGGDKPVAETQPEKLQNAVKILQFYPAEAIVAPGANVTICYGVENARSVRLEPPVEQIKPSINRCIQAKVPKTTEFKLIAKGEDGVEVTASFIVTASASARPDRQQPGAQTTEAQVTAFSAEPARIRAGDPPVKLCYQTQNAQSVRIEPRVADLGSVPLGCFYAPTSRTTTYTLTATGPAGQSHSRRVTVTVD